MCVCIDRWLRLKSKLVVLLFDIKLLIERIGNFKRKLFWGGSGSWWWFCEIFSRNWCEYLFLFCFVYCTLIVRFRRSVKTITDIRFTVAILAEDKRNYLKIYFEINLPHVIQLERSSKIINRSDFVKMMLNKSFNDDDEDNYDGHNESFVSKKYHKNYEKTKQKIIIIVENKKNHSGHVGFCFVDKSRRVCQLYLYRFFCIIKNALKKFVRYMCVCLFPCFHQQK